MSEENQNETPIVLGSRANETVKCAECGKELVVGDMHSFQNENGDDVYFCPDCMKKINAAINAESQNQNIKGAIILGVICGILGGLLWFLLSVILKSQIGYMAIGLGWFVAMGVQVGAGNKKGNNLQFISAGITLLSLIVAEMFIIAHIIGEDPSMNMSALNVIAYAILNGYIGKFLSLFVQYGITPIGLLIWGIGIYTAYILPKPAKI